MHCLFKETLDPAHYSERHALRRHVGGAMRPRNSPFLTKHNAKLLLSIKGDYQCHRSTPGLKTEKGNIIFYIIIPQCD